MYFPCQANSSEHFRTKLTYLFTTIAALEDFEGTLCVSNFNKQRNNSLEEFFHKASPQCRSFYFIWNLELPVCEKIRVTRGCPKCPSNLEEKTSGYNKPLTGGHYTALIYLQYPGITVCVCRWTNTQGRSFYLVTTWSSNIRFAATKTVR